MLPSTLVAIASTLFIWWPTINANQDKPGQRWANECLVLDGALYCFGGEMAPGQYTNDMYSLDLYASWSVSDPAWTREPQASSLGPTVAYYAAAVLPGRSWFLLNGGITHSPYQTYFYDSQLHQWNAPTMKGPTMIQRKQHSATADNEGRLWIWGGMSDVSTYGGPTIYHNTWTVIDTNTWAYSYPIVHDPPPPRVDHTATVMASGEILIIGGVVYSRNVTDLEGGNALNPISMSSLLLFDTAAGQWSNITAGGNIPAPRRGHTAVLSSDDISIIIFGGGMPEDENTLLNDVFVLDLSSMRWNAPSITGVPPEPRKYHQASLVDGLMLVLFGLGEDNQGYNDVNILNTKNWAWITQYTADPARLSGNVSSAHDVLKNSTGSYSDTRSNTRNPDGTPSFPVDDPNSDAPNDDDPFQDPSDDVGSPAASSGQIRITSGVIAGVISGGVVAVGGGVFLIVTLVIYQRRRRQKAKSKEKDAEPSICLADTEGTLTPSGVILTPVFNLQKPNHSSWDNQSSHKPNER